MPGKERRGTSRRPGPFPPSSSSSPFPHSLPGAARSAPRVRELRAWTSAALSSGSPGLISFARPPGPVCTALCGSGLLGAPQGFRAGLPLSLGCIEWGAGGRRFPRSGSPFLGVLATGWHPIWALLPACALLGRGSSGSLWAPQWEEGGRDPKPEGLGSWGMRSGIGGTLGRKEGGLAAKSGARK